MIPLDVFTPTKVRDFTYYDRAAIRLDAEEMRAVRVRVSVYIQGTPVSRSLNLKYPFYKEFFGYAQAFMLNTLMFEWPINYSQQYVWDYVNPHAITAHQTVSALQKLSDILSVFSDVFIFLLPVNSQLADQALPSAKEKLRRITEGFTKESGLGIPGFSFADDYVNYFNHPWDLLRFRFPLGTIFQVRIESWQSGTTGDGAVGGNPITENPYPTDNPNGQVPTPTPGGRNPNAPYGLSPPPQSPRDNELDPNDYANAPDPDISRGYRGVAIGNVQVGGVDGSPRFIDIFTPCFDQPITFGFEQNPGAPGKDAIVRSLSGELLLNFFTNDLLAEASLTVERCDLG